MKHFPSSPKAMFTVLWCNKALIKAFVKRDILGRYRGSILGMLWSFFNPLFMLAVYTFVFSEVFNARWGVGTGSKAEFALILFAGMLMFNLFSETINQAPNIILSNTNYVKKVVFPLEILPVVNLLSSLFHAGISLIVWILAYSILIGIPHASSLFIPFIIIPYIFFILGLSWIISSLGVYLRDVSQIIGVLTTVLMFMSGVFYPISSLPEHYRSILYLNPLVPFIEQARDVLYFGKSPDLLMNGIIFIMSLLIAWVGFAWFQNTRKGFSDVI
ncbi:ABC transporter permease [Aeromonas sp. DNP9]|uniref:ABC transporter permease n=1 Tax=Aeromonas sp. DNP9 TaxID=1535548 RepID=UPI0009F2249D|nr:ABC transporter permease [Aeromonas sp. DNP9]